MVAVPLTAEKALGEGEEKLRAGTGGNFTTARHSSDTPDVDQQRSLAPRVGTRAVAGEERRALLYEMMIQACACP